MLRKFRAPRYQQLKEPRDGQAVRIGEGILDMPESSTQIRANDEPVLLHLAQMLGEHFP